MSLMFVSMVMGTLGGLTWRSHTSWPWGSLLKAITFQSGTDTLITRSRFWFCRCRFSADLLPPSSSAMTRCFSVQTSPLATPPSRKFLPGCISGMSLSSKFPTLKFHLAGGAGRH